MKTQCSACKATFNAPDNYLGKKAKCSRCKESFTVAPIKTMQPEQSKQAPVEKPSTYESAERPSSVAMSAEKVPQNNERPSVSARSSENKSEEIGEQTLFNGNPKMFQNSPIAFILCIFLAPIGLGVLLLIIWFLRCKTESFSLTTKRAIHRTGILSKTTNEVFLADVRNVKVSQRVLQRIFKVGKVEISTAGHSGVEIVVSGYKDPQKIADIIRQRR